MPGDGAIKEVNLRFGPGRSRLWLWRAAPRDTRQISSLSERG